MIGTELANDIIPAKHNTVMSALAMLIVIIVFVGLVIIWSSNKWKDKIPTNCKIMNFVLCTSTIILLLPINIMNYNVWNKLSEIETPISEETGHFFYVDLMLSTDNDMWKNYVIDEDGKLVDISHPRKLTTYVLHKGEPSKVVIKKYKYKKYYTYDIELYVHQRLPVSKKSQINN